MNLLKGIFHRQPTVPLHERARQLEEAVSADAPLHQRTTALQHSMDEIVREYRGDAGLVPARMAAQMAARTSNDAPREEIIRLGLQNCGAVTAAAAPGLAALALKMIDLEMAPANKSDMATAAVHFIAPQGEPYGPLLLAPVVDKLSDPARRLTAGTQLLRAAASQSDSDLRGLSGPMMESARVDADSATIFRQMGKQFKQAGHDDIARTCAFVATAYDTVSRWKFGHRLVAFAMQTPIQHSIEGRLQWFSRLQQPFVDLHSLEGHAAAGKLTKALLPMLERDAPPAARSWFALMRAALPSCHTPERVLRECSYVWREAPPSGSGQDNARLLRALWTEPIYSEAAGYGFPPAIFGRAADLSPEPSYKKAFTMLERCSCKWDLQLGRKWLLQRDSASSPYAERVQHVGMITQALSALRGSNPSCDPDPIRVVAQAMLKATNSLSDADFVLSLADDATADRSTREALQSARAGLRKGDLTAAREAL